MVEKLQELLSTKGSAESVVMDLLGNPALIKHLMTLTDQQVAMCVYAFLIKLMHDVGN